MKKTTYFLFLIVPMILVVGALLLPLVGSLLPTFLQPSEYVRFFQDEYNRTIFYRSIRLSLITTVLCILLGLPTSYWLSLLSEKKRRLLNSLILFPLLTNAVVRGFAWITILSKNGIINQALKAIHLPTIQLLYTDAAIVIGSVYLFLPVMVNTLSPVMENIGSETIEAAHTLGAKPVVVFLKVVLPLSFSGLLIAGVMVFAGSISAYTTPTLLGGNKKMMLASLLYQQTNALSNWDAASRIAFIMLICSLGVQKLFSIISKKVDRREAQNV